MNCDNPTVPPSGPLPFVRPDTLRPAASMASVMRIARRFSFTS